MAEAVDPAQFDCAGCEEQFLKEAYVTERITFAEYMAGHHVWLCLACGDKRCPKASWHDNLCANQ